MTTDGSRYSEKETAAIIKRALELQHARSGGDVSAGSLHLEEIERVGAEVGIQSDLIRQAADELRQNSKDFSRSFWLGARSLQAAEGDAPAPHAGSRLTDLLPIIDDAAGRDGGGRLVGDILQWRSRLDLLRVSVKPGPDGKVTTHVEMRIFPAAAGLFPGIVGGLGLGAGLGVGLGVGIAVLGSPLFCVAVPVGALALSWLLARTIYRRVAQSAARAARKIVEAVRRSLAS